MLESENGPLSMDVIQVLLLSRINSEYCIATSFLNIFLILEPNWGLSEAVTQVNDLRKFSSQHLD